MKKELTREDILSELQRLGLNPVRIDEATPGQPDVEFMFTPFVSAWLTPADGWYVTKAGVRFASGLMLGEELARAVKYARSAWKTVK